MNDLVTVIAPTVPVNTRKTDLVSEMFSIAPSNVSPINYVYDIGLPINGNPTTYAIKNETTNADLEVKIIHPDFIKLNTDDIILLKAQHTANITVMPNDSFIYALSLSGPRIANSELAFNVVPVNVTGPIYVPI